MHTNKDGPAYLHGVFFIGTLCNFDSARGVASYFSFCFRFDLLAFPLQ